MTTSPVRTRVEFPKWCAGRHSGDGLDIYHYAEAGRIQSGELTAVVSVTAWSTEDKPELDPAVTLSWHGSNPDDNGIYLQDGIEFMPAEIPMLIPLLSKAHELLESEGQR